MEEILWSDPHLQDGFQFNALRGGGHFFGKGALLDFCARNNIAFVVRGHEGPDARELRPAMNSIMTGFSLDFKRDDGRPLLITVFSASNYPVGPYGRRNQAAYIRLDPLDFHIDPHSFYTTSWPEMRPVSYSPEPQDLEKAEWTR